MSVVALAVPTNRIINANAHNAIEKYFAYSIVYHILGRLKYLLKESAPAKVMP